MIRLIRLGILSRLRKNGTKRIMKRISENCRTGFFRGSVISVRPFKNIASALWRL